MLSSNNSPCALADFPYKYLGLPLAISKLKKSTFSPSLIRWQICSSVEKLTCLQEQGGKYMFNLFSQ
jgi:hypothetical protein